MVDRNSPGDQQVITTKSFTQLHLIVNLKMAFVNSFREHQAEVISCHFNNTGKILITGSFDETAMIWDVRVKEPTHILRGHEAEISNCIWNFSFDLIATSSLDGTVKVWDLRNIKEPQFCLKHRDEVLDVCFDYTGKIATCSSDCTAKVWDEFGKLLITLEGHTDEVSKVCFSPNGSLILTASAGERNQNQFLFSTYSQT